MYDQDKDVMIHLCQPPYRSGVNGKEIQIQVGVFRYGNSFPKIGINRLFSKGGQMAKGRLGRLNSEEAHYILEKLPEVIEKLESAS